MCSSRDMCALGHVALEEVVGQREEPLPVLDGDADDVGDHVHRQLVGDLRDEVALSELQCPVDDRLGPLPDLVLELLDHARGEAGADEPALPDVVAAVHADEHRPGDPRLMAQLRPVEGTEQLGVAADRLDVLVLRQHPEPLVVVAREALGEGLPLHRCVRGAGR